MQSKEYLVMEVYIDSYHEEILSISLKAFGRILTTSLIDYTKSKFRVVNDETEEVIAYGFMDYDSAVQYIRHHEWILC